MNVILCKPNCEAQVVELPKKHTYKDILKLLECEVLTCVSRKIGSHYYDLWCDDEGLFPEMKYCSATCKNANEMLCGNIVIARHDCCGNTIGLTKEELEEVLCKGNWIDNDEFIRWQTMRGGEVLLDENKDLIIATNYAGFGIVRLDKNGKMLRYSI